MACVSRRPSVAALAVPSRSSCARSAGIEMRVMMDPTSDELAEYEAEFEQLQELIDRLFNDSGATSVILVDKNGQLIASSGDQKALSTTDGPAAQRFGGGDRAQLPKDIRLVGGRAILVALFPPASRLVLPDDSVRRLSEALQPILDELDRKVHAGFGQLFPEVTQEDIHDLLAD